MLSSGEPDAAHHPRRDDDVANWLKRLRDGYRDVSVKRYEALDRALDRYRECADYGLTLRPEDEGAGDP